MGIVGWIIGLAIIGVLTAVHPVIGIIAFGIFISMAIGMDHG
jgi:hypothetical protein